MAPCLREFLLFTHLIFVFLHFNNAKNVSKGKKFKKTLLWTPFADMLLIQGVNGGERMAGGEKKKRLSGRFLTFTTLLFSLYLLTSNVNKKKKKNPEGLNVFFSVNYFKGPMEILRDKRPLCLQADCILRSQIPAVVQEDEAFSFFIQSCYVLLHWKKREIFCNLSMLNRYVPQRNPWRQQKVLRRKVSVPHLPKKKKNTSLQSLKSFLCEEEKKTLLTSLWFTFYCFSAVAGPQQVHGVHGITDWWWAPFPQRPSVGGRS